MRQLLQTCKLPVDDLERNQVVLFLAEHDGVIIACAGLELYPPVALLRSVAVRPAWQGHSVGRKMTQTALDSARTQRIRTVYLLTTTAKRYFARMGFQNVDREHVPKAIADTEEFQSICPSTAAVMKLEL
ncbi:MAG: arsenic resistance N-acetyltransferase ArsN2 [candidate division KSB1 bacterium]|nr:arsenic resistance N-acetyltransferase ArsN2 [candidate division KSB1 bacterium]